MAMVLQKTRLRLTQAIYFGLPPVVGGAGTVTSIAASTGITLTPNPIIGAGTVGLTVPVTVPNGGTGAITLTGILKGNGVGAITGGATVSLTTDVTGILPVANGGSGVGTITGLLRGNGVGVFTGSAQASLTTEVTGILPYANGGTNASTAWTPGSVIFAGATSYAQDNANFFWDDATNRLGVGTNTPTSPLTVNGTMEIKAGSGGVLKFADGTSQASAAVGGGNISGAGTATNIAFYTAGQTISSDNALYWDNAAKRLGVGTNVPASKMTVSDNSATLPAPPSGTTMHFGGQDSVNPRLLLDAYAGTPFLTMRASAGTAAVPTAVVLDQGLASLGVFGRGTTAYFGSKGGFLFSAAEAWTDTANGTYAGLYTTAIGTAVNTERIRISDAGRVGINTAAPGAMLDVKDNAASCLRLSGSTSGYVGLRPNAAAGTVTYELPSVDGAAGQFLKTSGAAVLSWATPAGGGTVTTNGALSAGMVTFIDPGGATVITGEGNLFYDNTNNRLGILTSTPLAPLHVGAQNNAPVLTPQILVDVAGPAYITAKDTVDGTEATFGADGAGAYVGTNTNSNVNIVTNNVARAKFLPSGAMQLLGSVSGFVGLQGAAAAGGTTYTLPATDGTAGNVLTTNGAGVLSFAPGGGTSAFFDVTTFGAVADAKNVYDGAMLNGSNTLTSASNPFVVGDVGKPISVARCGPVGTTLFTTISGFTNAGQVSLTLTNGSGGNVTASGVSWGTDNTTAFTNALAAANTIPSVGSVYIPPGQYRFNTHLTIPNGVRMFGSGSGSKWANYGSVLHAVENSGNPGGLPFISVGFNSVLEQIAVFHPNQLTTTGTGPTTYPFAIKGAAYCTIQNIFMLNPYQGIDVASEVNNPYNGAFTLRGIHGEPLFIGIDVNKSYDVSEITDVHFWPFYSLSLDGTIRAWKRANGIGIRFGRSDYQFMHNIFVFGYQVGIQLNHNAAIGAGGTSGQWTNIQCDSGAIGIDVNETGFNGLLISNLYCSGADAFDGYGIRINNSGFTSIVTVNTAQFWGTLLYGIYVDNPPGWFNFSQIKFQQTASWHAWINRGATSLTNSQFLPSVTSNGINVAAGCAENVMLTSNQLFGTVKTVSNATTLDANNQA